MGWLKPENTKRLRAVAFNLEMRFFADEDELTVFKRGLDTPCYKSSAMCTIEPG